VESVKEELSAIGFIESKKLDGIFPYMVVQARSNSRKWLIPLNNRLTTVSGFALFQPLLLSARIAKFTALVLSYLGATKFLARRRIFLSGECVLRNYVPATSELVYAFFTGTAGPHRKLAVQIMDQRGHIEGFAKVSVNPRVESLLRHEAAMLEVVGCLKLQNANTPSLLYAGPCNGATLLVTDTLKTLFTRSVTNFTKEHKIFLEEFELKTRQPPQAVGAFANVFEGRLSMLLPRLAEVWQRRIKKALSFLVNNGDALVPCCMNHGDFTPWNTFLAKGKLYVFDWEYAEICAPQSNDLIHFLLSQSQLRKKTPSEKLAYIRSVLYSSIELTKTTVDSAIIVYLIGQVLRQLERTPQQIATIIQWDGMADQAALLDLLTAAKVEYL